MWLTRFLCQFSNRAYGDDLRYPGNVRAFRPEYERERVAHVKNLVADHSGQHPIHSFGYRNRCERGCTDLLLGTMGYWRRFSTYLERGRHGRTR